MANIKYKYTKEILQDAVSKSKNYSDVMRCMGIKFAGGTAAHLKRQISKFEINTSHFNRSLSSFLTAAKKKAFASRMTPEQIFNFSGEYRMKAKNLRRALIETGVEYKCVKCKIGGAYNGEPIVLEIDHIDENWNNIIVIKKH